MSEHSPVGVTFLVCGFFGITLIFRFFDGCYAFALDDFHCPFQSVAGCKSEEDAAMPSGMVALRHFDFGRAIDVFDLRLMPFSMSIGVIYFYLCVGRGVYIWFRAS